jgi:hypothetical protein
MTTPTTTLRERALVEHRTLHLDKEAVEAREREDAARREERELRGLLLRCFPDLLPDIDGLVVVWAVHPELGGCPRAIAEVEGITFEVHGRRDFCLVASLPRPGCEHLMSQPITMREALDDLGELLACHAAEQGCPDCAYEAREREREATLADAAAMPTVAERLVALLREILAPEVPF